jgi:hypothetical protein
MILPVVLYGCETWSLTLREEHRLRVFENRVLRGIFGPKGDEVTGEWRKLHNGELHNLYLPTDIVRSNEGELGGQGMWHARERGETCTGFWWESPLERPRRRWEDGIKMDIRQIGWGCGVCSSYPG